MSERVAVLAVRILALWAAIRAVTAFGVLWQNVAAGSMVPLASIVVPVLLLTGTAVVLWVGAEALGRAAIGGADFEDVSAPWTPAQALRIALAVLGIYLAARGLSQGAASATMLAFQADPSGFPSRPGISNPLIASVVSSAVELGIGVLLVASGRPLADGSWRRRRDVIRTRSLQMVDPQGIVRAEISTAAEDINRDTEPELVIHDREGNPMLRITIAPDDGLRIQDLRVEL